MPDTTVGGWKECRWEKKKRAVEAVRRGILITELSVDAVVLILVLAAIAAAVPMALVSCTTSWRRTSKRATGRKTKTREADP
jgi:hypothetical protein